MNNQSIRAEEFDLNSFNVSNEFNDIEFVLEGLNGESDIMMEACVRRC